MTTESDPTRVRGRLPGYRYEGPWIRWPGLVIDGVLLFAIIYVLFIVLGGLLFMAFPQAAKSSEMTPTQMVVRRPSGGVVLSVVMLAWSAAGKPVGEHPACWR